jgi:hypothetical protein
LFTILYNHYAEIFRIKKPSAEVKI